MRLTRGRDIDAACGQLAAKAAAAAPRPLRARIVVARICARRVVAILRCAEPARVGAAVIEGGVDVVEVPLGVPGARAAISSFVCLLSGMRSWAPGRS